MEHRNFPQKRTGSVSSNEAETKKCFVKLVVIGDSGVGKSSLIHFFQKGQFSSHFKPTIGADFANREVQLAEDRICVLQIWDTAGQERFQSLSAAFYRGADCCCMVYDITDPSSFEHLATWKKHFMSKSQPDDPTKLPFLVLGNKLDLAEQDKRCVPTEEVEKYCKENGDMIFFETSAKTSVNVIEGFNKLAEQAAQIQEENMIKQNLDIGASGNLRQKSGDKQEKKYNKNKAIRISRHNGGIEPEKKKKNCKC